MAGSAPQAKRLAEALGTSPPPGLEPLTESECGTLAAAFTTAKTQQRKALEAATEAALAHVPMLLRGAVRKVLFG